MTDLLSLLKRQSLHEIISEFTIKFLGAFSKLRKVTISFVMPVCPSFHSVFVHRHGTTRCPEIHMTVYLPNKSYGALWLHYLATSKSEVLVHIMRVYRGS